MTTEPLPLAPFPFGKQPPHALYCLPFLLFPHSRRLRHGRRPAASLPVLLFGDDPGAKAERAAGRPNRGLENRPVCRPRGADRDPFRGFLRSLAILGPRLVIRNPGLVIKENRYAPDAPGAG